MKVEDGFKYLEKYWDTDPAKGWSKCFDKAGGVLTLSVLNGALIIADLSKEKEFLCMKKAIEVIGKKPLDSKIKVDFKRIKRAFKVIQETDQKKVLSLIFKPEKPIEQLHLLNQVVIKLVWDKNEGQRKAIEEAEKKFEQKSLSSDEKQKFNRIKEAFAIKKLVHETDQKKVLSLIFEPKSVEKQLTLLKVSVQQMAWDKNKEQKKAIEEAIKSLEENISQPKEKQKLTEIKTVFIAIQNFNAKKQAKQQNPASEKHPRIHTVKVKENATCKKLQKICKQWQKKATLKADVANAVAAHGIDAKKKTLAFDSSFMTMSIAPSKGKLSKETTFYIAYDDHLKLQAVASVEFDKEKPQSLDELCTNPDNVVVLGDETDSVRGAGSSIIRHIAHDVLNTKKYKKKKIELDSLASAVDFYKKMGFKYGKDKSTFILHKDKMKALLDHKSDLHVMEKVEPKAEQLTA